MKIEKIKEVDVLDSNFMEKEHISQYIMSNCQPPNSNAKRKRVELKGSYSGYTIFKINNTLVWCQTREAEIYQEVVSQVTYNKVISWYVTGAGTTEIFFLYN